MGDTKEKVFCAECIHHSGLRACWNPKYVQRYPKEDTPITRAFANADSGDCMVLNQTNACPEFQGDLGVGV